MCVCMCVCVCVMAMFKDFHHKYECLGTLLMALVHIGLDSTK